MRFWDALKKEAEHQRMLRASDHPVRARDCVLARVTGLILVAVGAALFATGIVIAKRGWISIHFFAFGILAAIVGALQLLTGAHLILRPPRTKGATQPTAREESAERR